MHLTYLICSLVLHIYVAGRERTKATAIPPLMPPSVSTSLQRRDGLAVSHPNTVPSSIAPTNDQMSESVVPRRENATPKKIEDK